jgi:hypothetical protein
VNRRRRGAGEFLSCRGCTGVSPSFFFKSPNVWGTNRGFGYYCPLSKGDSREIIQLKRWAQPTLRAKYKTKGVQRVFPRRGCTGVSPVSLLPPRVGARGLIKERDCFAKLAMTDYYFWIPAFARMTMPSVETQHFASPHPPQRCIMTIRLG